MRMAPMAAGLDVGSRRVGSKLSSSGQSNAIISPLITIRQAGDPSQIRAAAAAIQTLRFREYRLFLRFQADAGEHPELKAPPGFQLTPAQENKVLHELDRRKAFEQVFVRMPRISKRALWNSMRDIGFVWIPDWDASWADFPGRWSRYAC